MDGKWYRASYEKSLTSRALACTPSGWEDYKKRGADDPVSRELKAIFKEEMALAPVPAWAEELIDRLIAPLPMCGHYTFPLPLKQITDAIREEKCPEFVYGCYTADAHRKTLMSYYIFCLDAWLKQSPLDIAKTELAMRDDLGKDWGGIVKAIYKTLGEPTEQKELLIRRLIHRLRWWVKSLIWPDDKRNRFMLDVYSGEIRGDEANWGAYGNSPFGDPYFTELQLPEIKALAEQIRQVVPEGKKLLELIESTWLCAPKVFRYVEKLILQIGNLGSKTPAHEGESILQCEDTLPDFASHRQWYASFVTAMKNRLADANQEHALFGAITPVKHWLVRLLGLKLKLYEEYNKFGKLVAAKASGKSFSAGTSAAN